MDQVYKNARFYFWIISGLVRRYHKLIISTFLVGLALFIISIKAAPLISQRFSSPVQVVGLVGSYTPSSLPFSIQRLISLGLTDVDISGQVIAGIASSWDVSEDGKTYTFTIKDDIYWHDGQRFTALDINYNLKDVVFTAPDEHTFVVSLKDPFTPLPNYLSKPLFKQGLIGVGSYKIQAITLKGEYVSTLNLEPLSPELPQMLIKFYQSETVAKTAFKLGEVGVLDELTDSDPFSSWESVEVRETPNYNQYIGVLFNLNDSFLKDKDIRQALSYAVSKSEQNRIISPISSKSWAYTNRVKSYEQDIEKAKETFADKEIGEETEITLSTTQQHYQLAQKIAQDWQALGIKVRLKVENGVPDEFQALVITQEIPADPDQYAFWHSTQEDTNITGYTNPKIDKLLEDGRKELDREKRVTIYFDFQRYLVEDAPAIFLHHPSTYTILRKSSR